MDQCFALSMQFRLLFDSNLFQAFYELSEKQEDNFLTDLGREVKDMISNAMNDLHLSDVLGCSPLEYKTSASFFDEDSLYRFYLDSVLPTVCFVNPSISLQLIILQVVDQGATEATGFFLCNSATLRYNLYSGEVTRNDVYTVNPFKDLFYYLPSLTGEQIHSLIGEMSRKSFHATIDRVAYLKDTQETAGYSRYYYSSITVEDDMLYDFICPEYDVGNWQGVFIDLFPASDTAFQLYPTEYDATSSLLEYVQEEMECSLDCLCPSIIG